MNGPAIVALPATLRKLFHDGVGADVAISPKLEKIHSNPSIYFVRDFLTDSDLDHFSKLIVEGNNDKRQWIHDGAVYVAVEGNASPTNHLKNDRDATTLRIEDNAIGTSLITNLYGNS